LKAVLWGGEDESTDKKFPQSSFGGKKGEKKMSPLESYTAQG